MSWRAFDLIAFDADDTLWHNERSYREGRDRFRRLLTTAGVDLPEDTIEARVTETELANLEYFGYGVSSFALSLIETAVDLTGGRVESRELLEVVRLAKQMLSEEIELFPGARETLAALAPTYPLMLITKGDLLHQTSKLERSGLQPYFEAVEVVSHKTPDVYSRIFRRHGIRPDRFLMVGNSLRSDVLPVIAAGGWAVHVPAELSWSHEHAAVPAPARARYMELTGLSELTQVVETLSQAAALRGIGEQR